MERLTKIYPNGAWGISRDIDDAILRLAAYEETGLEPEEIAKIREDVENGYLKSTARRYGISVDRLRELAEADRDGRCVVLPCKVGRSLWVHDKDGKPREMELGPPDIRCHCRDEDNLCMALCGAKKTGVCAYRLRNDGTDIGKTVFLTREAAEAALKGEANG